jgi:Protein of unknown function DUF262
MKKPLKTKTRDIEKKFAETAFRLSQERNDFFLPQILDFVHKEKWLNLRPEYQRRLVWDDKKRSLFIESLLLNVPIPPIFLYEWELGRYEVMDGQQRLSAIIDFYENGLALKGLEKWSELNGLRFRDLPDTLQRGLDRRRVSATVLLIEGPTEPPQKSDVRKLVFERLNTGGQHLNAQELRNCLYAGHFNDLLIQLSRERLFAEIWNIPPYEDNVDKREQIADALRDNRLYRRMQDCEIVLRFFAFRKRTNIKGSVRSMLDRCMEDHLADAAAEIDALATDFRARLKVAHRIFGEHAFHHENERGHWIPSWPLYDGVMVAIDRLWLKKDDLIKNRAEIVKGLTKLLNNKAAYEVIVGRPNTAKALEKRLELVTRAMDRSLKA